MNDETFVIIPAYNESKRIGDVLKETKKYVKNVVVVDDGSLDNTYEIALKYNVETLQHIINLGKGASLKTGCDYAIKKGAKILILMDSDGQHKPDDIPRFQEKLKNVDIVFGARKLNKKMPSILRFGNKFISTITNLLYGVNIKDTQNGYKAMTVDAYKKIRWDSQGYAAESEMVTNTGNAKLKYTQIDIHTIYLDKYKGTTVLDGMKIVFNMIIWRITKWH